jgi:hypothetical protein
MPVTTTKMAAVQTASMVGEKSEQPYNVTINLPCTTAKPESQVIEHSGPEPACHVAAYKQQHRWSRHITTFQIHGIQMQHKAVAGRRAQKESHNDEIDTAGSNHAAAPNQILP